MRKSCSEFSVRARSKCQRLRLCPDEIRNCRGCKAAHGALSRLVVGEGESEHYSEPEDRTDNHKLGAPGAIARMHEVENHERSLERGNAKSNHDIELPEILKGGPNRDGSAGHQRKKYGQVNFRRNNVLGHATFSPTLLVVPVNQI